MSGLRRITSIALVSLLVAGGLAVASTDAFAASAVNGPITRSEVLSRAKVWVNKNVKYSQGKAAKAGDGQLYRTDCAGFVALAWHLPSSKGGMSTILANNSSISPYASRLRSLEALQPGDALLKSGSHIVLFVKWKDNAHNNAIVWQQTSSGGIYHPDPGTIESTWSRSKINKEGYQPWMLKKIINNANVPNGPIKTAWNGAGGAKGSLGKALSPQTKSYNGGLVQIFEGGRITYTKATGARVIKWTSQTTARYVALSSEYGALGYPTSNLLGAARGGVDQHFQNGIIFHRSNTGARAVLKGPIFSAYQAQKYERGALGFPTSELYAAGGGGIDQHFENGIIFYKKTTGAYSVRKGAILNAYKAQKYERGALGYPTSNLYGAANGGIDQHFENGIIFSSSKSGTHAVPRGVIFDVYKAQSYERGALGYPTSEVYAAARGGRDQHFQGGIIFTSKAGTYAVPRGPLFDVYRAQSYERGALGYPTSKATTLEDGGTRQSFEGGTIYASADGAIIVIDPIEDLYEETGGPLGTLGYPTTKVQTDKNGNKIQQFKNGTILVDKNTGKASIVVEDAAAKLTGIK